MICKFETMAPSKVVGESNQWYSSLRTSFSLSSHTNNGSQDVFIFSRIKEPF